MEIISLKDIPQKIKKLISESGADAFVGSMPTTKGIYVLLFSHRLNKDFPLLVASNESSAVLTKVYEVLAGKPS